MADEYREWAPAAPLRTHLTCTWHRVVSAVGSPEPVRVVPDACMDLIWERGGGLQVAGPDTVPAPVVLRPGARYVGVRFRPGAAPPLLGLPSSALRDLRVDLADVWSRSEAECLEERLAAAPEAAAETLERSLIERLACGAEAPDGLVSALVARLTRRSAGVGTLAGQLGLSERHLRRRCEAAVGYGPKTLDRVLRFRRFLALARRGGDLAELAAAAGYADQAHLSRECRRLAGATPAQLQRP